MPERPDGLLPRFEDVHRIAVLRGGGLGDLLFALPAIEALAAAYPAARITLLGTPLAEALLRDRSGPVSQVRILPHASGIHSPAGREDPAAVETFHERMRAERFDLACQFHGGGRNSNPFLLRLGARHTIGTQTTDAARLERSLPYVYYQHEVFRWLEVAALAGAPDVGYEPRIEVTAHERAQASARLHPGGLVVLHPGSTDPRRRWPVERFAELAARCARDGHRVVVVGDGEDAPVADAVAGAARPSDAGAAVQSLAGRLSLSELVALLSAADVFVGNDSGPRHLAQAVGTATVGLYWFGNLINGGPMTRGRHRVQLGWTTRCPVCDVDVTQVGWTAERCPHDPSFLAGISVDSVYADVCALRATRAPVPGR
ncbi:glycosyltransferase family 9 protein [Microbacterium sp. BK668]|uniref:glycosyltransferase family 9 protein n=1 Tax=Microbacterium sp. BK668 TaxID=2512118 RepID=UPI001060FCDC|nr:glycosyltransferase family 9 protein [Microbacterium sp. BK668]TDN90694.1 ADP-heptose:LPS heptosyltransferase [Microbacterium sp. BK668]